MFWYHKLHENHLCNTQYLILILSTKNTYCWLYEYYLFQMIGLYLLNVIDKDPIITNTYMVKEFNKHEK